MHPRDVLVNAQRVSKGFYHTIKGSQNLLRKFWFETEPGSNHGDLHKRPRVNPILHELIALADVGGFTITYLEMPQPSGHWCALKMYQYGGFAPDDTLQVQLSTCTPSNQDVVARLTRPDASWRKMFLLDRPFSMHVYADSLSTTRTAQVSPLRLDKLVDKVVKLVAVKQARARKRDRKAVELPLTSLRRKVHK